MHHLLAAMGTMAGQCQSQASKWPISCDTCLQHPIASAAAAGVPRGHHPGGRRVVCITHSDRMCLHVRCRRYHCLPVVTAWLRRSRSLDPQPLARRRHLARGSVGGSPTSYTPSPASTCSPSRTTSPTCRGTPSSPVGGPTPSPKVSAPTQVGADSQLPSLSLFVGPDVPPIMRTRVGVGVRAWSRLGCAVCGLAP
jgi:hypothetical protein